MCIFRQFKVAVTQTLIWWPYNLKWKPMVVYFYYQEPRFTFKQLWRLAKLNKQSTSIARWRVWTTYMCFDSEKFISKAPGAKTLTGVSILLGRYYFVTILRFC